MLATARREAGALQCTSRLVATFATKLDSDYSHSGVVQFFPSLYLFVRFASTGQSINRVCKFLAGRCLVKVSLMDAREAGSHRGDLTGNIQRELCEFSSQ